MIKKRIVITQGNFAVSQDPIIEMSTLLGSCVSCCLWDSTTRTGGMNHMFLTRKKLEEGSCDLGGIHAMELVIQNMIDLGAKRQRLVAKVFGGAQMVQGLSKVGSINIEFTLRFLAAEGIACLGQSVGGETARQILFSPSTGVALQRIVSVDHMVV